MGFSALDVDFMFDGDERFSEMFETEEAEATKNTLGEIKEARANMNERMADRGNINFYCVLVFADENEKKDFYKKISTPIYEEYISAELLSRLNN